MISNWFARVLDEFLAVSWDFDEQLKLLSHLNNKYIVTLRIIWASSAENKFMVFTGFRENVVDISCIKYSPCFLEKENYFRTLLVEIIMKLTNH